VHAAIAGRGTPNSRARVDLSLYYFDAIGSGVGRSACHLPGRGRYLMDDLFRAGGLLAVPAVDVTDCSPGRDEVTGRSLAEPFASPVWDETVSVRGRATAGGTPDRAVLRAGPRPLRRGHQARRRASNELCSATGGRAVVVRQQSEDMRALLDYAGLDVR